MTGIDDRAVDRAIDAALRRIPLPEHAPDFWERVAARLSASPGSNGHAGSMVSDGAAPPEGPPPSARSRRPPRRRRPLGSPRRRLAVAIAAVVVLAAAGAVALARSPGGDRVETDPVDTPTTGGATTSTSTTVAAPRVPPGSEETVLTFLDALGRGDLAAAASLLGPRSEASITATDRTVDDVLREATEGYGTWAGASDRTASTVVLDPGEVVVVLHGTVSLEGAVEERTEAFPVRYAASAETWLVEPLALDPAGGRLTLVTPDPGAGGPPPTFARIDEVVATAPASGTAWLAVDDQAPTATTVRTDLRATWSLAAPLPPGPHTLTVAFGNDTILEATSAVYVVTS